MLRPIGNKIVVKLLTNETSTDTGFVIPDTIDEPNVKCGKVVAVGEGKFILDNLVPLAVKVDDVVYFAKFSGTEIVLNDDEKYTIITDNDVLAIVD